MSIEQAWKNLRIFMKEPKEQDDMLFDRIDVCCVLRRFSSFHHPRHMQPTKLNEYLNGIMEGLTAKVHRP